MGCDIHCYAEKRDAAGKWNLIGTFSRDEPEEGSEGYASATTVYSGRNYNLFAILADVRNGRGFAGIKTGEGFTPIAEPRGIPDDVCPEVKAIFDQWDIDGHSHSYHTLRQLLDFDWTQTTGLQGWCNAVEWAKWSRWDRGNGNAPDSYCGGVSGMNIKHVTADEMDKLLEPVAKVYTTERETFAEQYKETYALAQWTMTYARAAGDAFFNDVLPRLLHEAGGTSGLDDVRIVFCFDS